MLLFFTTSIAAPTASALEAGWGVVDPERWTYQPHFDSQDFKRLAEGKIVKRRERLDGADRVVAAIWTPSKKDTLWVAIQDEAHAEVVSGYVGEDLPGSVFSDRLLYQRIALPWPFASRQWVVRVRSNRELLQASKDKIWERTWDVSDRRGAQAEDPDGVWVESNSGGWVLCEAGSGNLLVYTVRASIGGNLPDEAATQWALMTVSGMLTSIAERARTVPHHYTGNHTPIERPDGSKIPPFDG